MIAVSTAYAETVEEIEDEGKFSRSIILKAVRKAVEDLSPEEDDGEAAGEIFDPGEDDGLTSVYTIDSVVGALDSAKVDKANTYLSDISDKKYESNLIKYAGDKDKAEKMTMQSIKQSLTSHYKPIYRGADRKDRAGSPLSVA